LPLLTNQWANVVRWEMRTRMFLRTSEFLWQEGHTAHETAAEARAETLKMLEEYRAFAEGPLAMPVVAGEKPENERFPGADATWSIEAMTQDGKALQAGTSHFLGQTFSKAQNIRFQDREGGYQHAWTTSWGVSTRMVGGVIMTHGDDDGLRVPPQIAPQQIVIVPMLRENDGDEALLAWCDALAGELAGQSAFGEPLRVLVDRKGSKAATKRWNWVKKGAPLILEIGGRDVENDKVSLIRRDRLYQEGGKVAFDGPSRADFIAQAPALLTDIEAALHREAKARMEANIRRDVADWDALAGHFAETERYPGWVELSWCRPTGADLDAVVERLKTLKLTFRNVPLDSGAADGPCFFTGRPAVERILVARAY
jgi:prolyl-tRNA synthetase